jgi:hypothetical protein
MSWEAILLEELAKVTIRHKKEILDFFTDLFKKDNNIALFGVTGTGKSEFVESLVKSGANVTETLSARTTKFYIDSQKVFIHDTPGHNAAETIREEVLAELIKKDFVGVIFLVSDGYHQRDGIVDVEKLKTDRVFFENWINERRTIEIEFLSSIGKSLRLSNIKWVITLISKADIWWGNKLIRKQYEELDYAKKMKEVIPRATHYVIPYCSTIEPFYGFYQPNNFGRKEEQRLQNNFHKTFVDILKRS